MLMLDRRHPDLEHIVGDDPVGERIAAGFGFTEGPLWRGSHLLFSDIPNSRIVRWEQKAEGPELTTFRTPSGNANGHTLDRQGRLVSCEHSARRVSRTEADGSVVTLADAFEGKRLNSPNDVVVRNDGSLYFTDPPYGLPNLTEGKELDFHGVYRLDFDGSGPHLLVDDFDRPNGLAFSLDESRLYVADTARHHIRAFDVAADGSISGGDVFAVLRGNDGEIGGPDGMKVDVEGNVYCTARGGLWVVSGGGTVLGRIILPEQPANCGWGGSDWTTLYLTARTGVYRVELQVAGIAV